MIKCICGLAYPKHGEKCINKDNMFLVMHFKENWKVRYFTARYEWYKRTKPDVVKNSFFYNSPLPKVSTANGLTKFICNFLLWSKSHATRVSSAGRYIEKKNHLGQKIIGSGMFIPSTTRKGTADIVATINGRAVYLEIKVGKDKSSTEQLREQKLIQEAGGVYEFISTPEQFFTLYDNLK